MPLKFTPVLEELTEEQILEQYKPTMIKLKSPVTIYRERNEIIFDLRKNYIYRKLISYKNKGIKITENLADKIYGEKQEKVSKKTNQQLANTYCATFGRIVRQRR